MGGPSVPVTAAPGVVTHPPCLCSESSRVVCSVPGEAGMKELRPLPSGAPAPSKPPEPLEAGASSCLALGKAGAVAEASEEEGEEGGRRRGRAL